MWIGRLRWTWRSAEAMGSITRFLQEAFAAQCPKGWRCEAEVPLVGRSGVSRLGFEPRGDVRLTEDNIRRLSQQLLQRRPEGNDLGRSHRL
jgi:hypothetical protein